MRKTVFGMFCILLIFGCKEDCVIPERCKMKPMIDPCFAAIPKYYFDEEENKCKEYTWGGCTPYPFDTMEECEVCKCKN